MIKSALFSAVYRNDVILLRKSKSSSHLKKTYVGEAIKKLNKENKSLFGDLLETRPQKRKREAMKLPTNTAALDQKLSCHRNEKSSEELWFRRTLPLSCVHIPKNVNEFCKVTLTSNTEERCKIVEQSVKVQEKQHDINLNCKIQNEANKFNVVGPHNFDSDNYKVPVLNKEDLCADQFNSSLKSEKRLTLELPGVIIRNLPSFPLVNEGKDKDSMLPSRTVLSISPYNENDKRKDFLLYPSVSKILNATMPDSSRVALKRWRQRMISELGEEGFLIHYRGLLDKGSQFHSAIQDFLSGRPDLKVEPQIQGCWQSLTNVIQDITDVRVLESHVIHSSLLYRGIIDCVAHYKGKPVLIEWKKSDKQKPEIEKTYDAPLQLSAYVGAMNYDINYNFQVTGGLVVVAYSDGSPAHTFKMSLTECNKYWKMWLLRLQQYWLQQSQKEG